MALDGYEGRHAGHALRVRPGEHIRVGDGRGVVADCEVTHTAPGRVDAVVTARDEVARPSPAVTVVQALPKSDRSELAVELAATVGRVLGIAALVTDPDEIVIAGEVGNLLEPVLPALRDAVSRHCLVGADLQVRSGEIAHQQGARGAIAALRALDQPLSRPRPARTGNLPHPDEGVLSVR